MSRNTDEVRAMRERMGWPERTGNRAPLTQSEISSAVAVGILKVIGVVALIAAAVGVWYSKVGH